MAEDRDDREGPSLEPPSLFGRKRKPKPAPAPPVRAPQAAPPVLPAQAAPPVLPAQAAPPVPPVARSAPAVVSAPPNPPAPVAAVAPAAPQEPVEPREPWLTGPPAAVLSGLLVGVLVVLATAGSLRVCTAVKGTSSCGGPGVFLLLAILVAAVLVGSVLLRAAGVPEAGSTSFLAVGLLSVVTLLFLVGHLFAWWMILVIPVIAVLTFLLSWWITTTYVDSGDDEVPEVAPTDRPHSSYDVR